MNNKPIVWLRSLRMTTDKHLSSNNALFLSSANAPCVALLPASMQSNAAHQSGVVLIISLIMLLLLTLIGASSIQTTSLEEKMAGNMRDKNLAFQAAETALRAGESIVMLNSPAFSVANNGTGGTGLYTTIGTGALANYYNDPTIWTNATKIATYTGGSLNHIHSAPRYIIEELTPTSSTSGTTTNTSGSLEAGTAAGSQTITWYRITARGTGASDNAVVILQSIYRR